MKNNIQKNEIMNAFNEAVHAEVAALNTADIKNFSDLLNDVVAQAGQNQTDAVERISRVVTAVYGAANVTGLRLGYLRFSKAFTHPLTMADTNGFLHVGYRSGQHTTSDEQFIAVILHEAGHVMNGHMWTRYQWLATALSAALAFSLNIPLAASGLAWYLSLPISIIGALAVGQLLFAQLYQYQEYSADRFVASYGFAPEMADWLEETNAEWIASGAIPHYIEADTSWLRGFRFAFSTHPSVASRVHYLRNNSK